MTTLLPTNIFWGDFKECYPCCQLQNGSHPEESCRGRRTPSTGCLPSQLCLVVWSRESCPGHHPEGPAWHLLLHPLCLWWSVDFLKPSLFLFGRRICLLLPALSCESALLTSHMLTPRRGGISCRHQWRTCLLTSFTPAQCWPVCTHVT